MARKQRSLRKLLLVVLAACVGLVVIGGAVTKYFFAPAAVRQRLRAGLSDYWEGTVEVGEVSFSYFGPIRLREVELAGLANSTRVLAGQVVLHMKDYPSVNPVITDVEVTDLAIQLSGDGEGLDLPLELPDVPADQAADLESVEVTGVSLSLDRGPDRRHELRLDRIRLAKRGESVKLTVQGAGLAAEMEISATRGGGRALQIAVGGTAFGGRLDADMESSPPPDVSPALSGTLTAENLRLDEMAKLVGRQGSNSGLLSLDVQIAGPGLAVAGLTGSGTVKVTGVDASRTSLTRTLLSILEGSPPTAKSQSDVRVVFDLAGSVATLREGELVDALRAMKIEEGGTVNLRSGRLDFYLITLQVKGVSGLLTKIPVVSLATALTNKLTRVHVTGTWGDHKITKEPVRDVSAATLEFFKEILSPTSGPRGPVDGLTEVLKVLSGPREQAGPAASAPASGK